MRKFLTVVFVVCSVNVLAHERTYSTIIYDPANQVEMAGQGVAIQRPMASLTKIMTAMVSLDQDQNLDHRIGGISKENLFRSLLIRSNNNVAELLSKNYPGGRTAFIAALNRKAQALGMWETHFDDPSGRIRTNVSTAYDVAMMIQAAHNYPEIRRISTYHNLTTTHSVGKRRHRHLVSVQQPNTNILILQEFNQHVEVSKTGFTNPAGYCVAVVVRHLDRPYIVVIMGARNPHHRLDIIRDLYHREIESGFTRV